MAYRDNELAVQALETQGFWVGEAGDAAGNKNYLETDTLARKCADVFLDNPADARPNQYGALLVDIQRGGGFGITKEQLVERVLPGFRGRYELDPAEEQLLRDDGRDAHPDLALRADAIREVESLLWGTISKDGRSGDVQQLLVHKSYLLVDMRVTRDGHPTRVKVATNDDEVILRHYVHARGKKVVNVSNSVAKDVELVTSTFPAMTAKVRAQMGIQVTAAVLELTDIADVNAGAIAARQGPAAPAITTDSNTRAATPARPAPARPATPAS